jgi:alkylated DNA repair protein alkB homolog 6
MATIIDFKAMMKEERRKMKESAATTPRQQEVGTSNSIPSEKIAIDKFDVADHIVFDSSFTFPSRTPQPIQVISNISTISYVQNYVTEAESMRIVDLIHSVPMNHSKWVHLKGRSLQCWDGLHENMPCWLSMLCDGLVQSGLFPLEDKPNHVLINRYNCGEGILPHTDGPKYVHRTVILTLSASEFEGLDTVRGEDVNLSTLSTDVEITQTRRKKRKGAMMVFQRRLKTSEVKHFRVSFE